MNITSSFLLPFDASVLNASIIALIIGLGADDFRVRERSHVALTALDAAAVPYLELSEKDKAGDAERLSRVRAILAAYYERNAVVWAAETRPGNYPLTPWLTNCNAISDSAVLRYIDRARDKLGGFGQPPNWNEYRLATTFAVEDMYRNRKPRSYVAAFLTELVEKEREWFKQYGKMLGVVPPQEKDLPR